MTQTPELTELEKELIAALKECSGALIAISSILRDGLMTEVGFVEEEGTRIQTLGNIIDKSDALSKEKAQSNG